MPQSSTDIIVRPSPLLIRLVAWIVVFGPGLVLLLVAIRMDPSPLLAGGIATEAFLALGLLNQMGAARAASHKTVSPIYLIGVLILWLASQNSQAPLLQAAMFVLVGVPLSLFVVQEFILVQYGGLRRARALVRRLAAKTDWPRDLLACKALPEVKKALREALHDDAEPVLVLLMHPKPQVRIAALAALEFRPQWKKGQPEVVLQAAKFATEPPVRCTALMALANIDDSHLVALVAVYLRF